MQQNPPNPTANQSYVQAQQQNPHFVQTPQQNQSHAQAQQQNPHYVQASQQNQQHVQAQQQNQFHQSSANLNPTQMQMQPPVQVPAGAAGNVQGQQNMGQAKNQMNHVNCLTFYLHFYKEKLFVNVMTHKLGSCFGTTTRFSKTNECRTFNEYEWT